MNLRGLTLYPQHAFCVWRDDLAKDVENRSRAIVPVGSRIAVHAGSWYTSKPKLALGLDELRAAAATHAGVIVSAERDGKRFTGRVALQRPDGPVTRRADDWIDLPRSAIVALATVSEILPATDRPTRAWHLPGQVGHVLSDLVRLRHPLRHVSGKVGPWNADRYLPELADRETLARGFFVDSKGQDGASYPTARAALGARAAIRADRRAPRVFVLPDGPQIDDTELMRLVERERGLDLEAARPWNTPARRKSLAESGKLRPHGRPAKNPDPVEPAQLVIGGAA